MKSMTGFGRGSASSTQFYAGIEISTVNRKQLDIRFAAPKEALFLDPLVRKAVSEQLSRGSIQVKLNFRVLDTQLQGLKINEERLLQYKEEISRAQQLLGLTGELSVSDLLALPELFQESDIELDVDAVWQVVEEALSKALEQLIVSRSDDGENMRCDFVERQKILKDLFLSIEAQAPQVLENYRKKLHERIQEAQIDIEIDDERLLKEIALFADRCDISEELVRLRAHLAKFLELIERVDPVGRELDFLMQECNREINTTGSKGNDQLINQQVVAFKAELERCREQIQNVE